MTRVIQTTGSHSGCGGAVLALRELNRSREVSLTWSSGATDKSVQGLPGEETANLDVTKDEVTSHSTFRGGMQGVPGE
jgi:hypothetical protein